MMNPQIGKYLIIAGVLFLLAGFLIYFFSDKLHWIGKLPGDFRFERENFRFYFPLTTMILLSLLLSILIKLFRKF